MPREKSFDEDKVLEAVMLLFWKKGYEATSMQAIENATGLKRTSLYNTFGNKRSLFQKSLMRYLSTVLARFLTVLGNAPTVNAAISDVLHEVIELHYNRANPGGCMVVLSLLESHQHDAKTKKMLESALAQLQAAIVARINKGIIEGELSKDIPSRALGSQVTAWITGMIVMAKAKAPRKDLEQIAALAAATLLKNEA